MMKVFEFLADNMDTIMGVAFTLIVVLAIIRIMVKASKGESISVPPVGAMKDLPSSITGISKNGDLSDWSNERADKKID